MHTSGNDISRPTGWRKATAALVKSQQMATEGQGRESSRTRAIVAVKRVAAHIGLKAGDLLLLDTLMAFSQPQDWETGSRAIVWPSNAYLMERTGFSLSTLKRHARRLADACVLSFHDSPNGKRWGHRDAHGRITEAYGFDLTPLAARADEFEALEAAKAEERAERRRLKSKITILRRSARARLEAMTPNAEALWRNYERLCRQSPTKQPNIESLHALYDAYVALLADIETQDKTYSKETGAPLETQKVAPREAKNEPHIQNTNHLKPVSKRHKAPGTGQVPTEQEKRNEQETARDLEESNISLSSLVSACPQFTEWAELLGQRTNNWAQAQRISEALRPMIGISDQHWDQAKQHLTGPVLTTAFALLFEKTQAGEIKCPGGYLRGMAKKAERGELRLNRSLKSRISRLAA